MFRKAFVAVLLIAALGALFLGWASRNARQVHYELFTRKTNWATVSAFDGKVYLLHNWVINPGHQAVAKEFDLGPFRFSSTIKSPMRVTLLTGPFWLPSALFLLIVGTPLFYIWRRKIRRQMTGFCTKCGYSLAGLETPRCPECGNVARTFGANKFERIVVSRTFALFLLMLLIVPCVRLSYLPVFYWARAKLTGTPPPAPPAPPSGFQIPATARLDSIRVSPATNGRPLVVQSPDGFLLVDPAVLPTVERTLWYFTDLTGPPP